MYINNEMLWCNSVYAVFMAVIIFDDGRANSLGVDSNQLLAPSFTCARFKMGHGLDISVFRGEREEIMVVKQIHSGLAKQ
jgi:hypothetical protein